MSVTARLFTAVPGTGVSFQVEGSEDAQITLELEPETAYKVSIDSAPTGAIKTNLGGKLVLSVELGEGKCADVKVEKL